MHTEGQNPSEGIAPLVSAPRTSGNLLGRAYIDYSARYEPDTIDTRQTLTEDALASIAVSLKRIADALTDFDVTVDRHGDFTFRVQQAINEGMRR